MNNRCRKDTPHNLFAFVDVKCTFIGTVTIFPNYHSTTESKTSVFLHMLYVIIFCNYLCIISSEYFYLVQDFTHLMHCVK